MSRWLETIIVRVAGVAGGALTAWGISRFIDFPSPWWWLI